MSPRPSNVLIFGASVRAAAFSALRAGFTPWCADLFADADLALRCPVQRLSGPYPLGFLDLLGTAPAGPWLYTGGLENHPMLVGQMQDRRRLWGNGPATLLRVRAPETLAAAAEAAGLPAPAQTLSGHVPREGSWLLKPRHGSGGQGIRLASGGDPIPTGLYAQEWIAGTPAAALYVAVGRRSVYLGLTRQLVGAPWLAAPAFRYCGSIGPLVPSPALAEKLRHLGAILTVRADLAGIFGIDGLLSGDTFRPIEVNPRYTAAIEVVEFATGLRALDLHRRAFEFSSGTLPAEPVAHAAVVGKAILYASAEGVFPKSGPWQKSLGGSLAMTPDFADIPHPGEKLTSGQPILTLFATGRDEAQCEQRLRSRADEVMRCLYPDRQPPAAGERT